jgi:hypothetical protein
VNTGRCGHCITTAISSLWLFIPLQQIDTCCQVKIYLNLNRFQIIYFTFSFFYNFSYLYHRTLPISRTFDLPTLKISIVFAMLRLHAASAAFADRNRQRPGYEWSTKPLLNKQRRL